MRALEFRFAAPVLRQPGGLRAHYLPLPSEVASALDEAGVRRVLVDLNGKPFRRAVQHSKDVGAHLVTGLTVLRQAGAAHGDMVDVFVRPDPEPERVDVPEELAIALDQDAEAGARFRAMTPGQRRSIAMYVEQARRPETRIKRALELAYKLRTYTLHGDTGPPGA